MSGSDISPEPGPEKHALAIDDKDPEVIAAIARVTAAAEKADAEPVKKDHYDLSDLTSQPKELTREELEEAIKRMAPEDKRRVAGIQMGAILRYGRRHINTYDPSTQCRLCFKKRGLSKFSKVGRYAVQHEDCSIA